MTSRLASVLALSISFASCGRAAPPPSDPVPPASEPPRAAAACSPDEDRCVSDAEADACANGARSRVPCADDAVCLEGRCVALPWGAAPTEGTVRAAVPAKVETKARDRLLSLGGDGWLNGWSVVTPLGSESVEPFQRDPDAAFTAPLSWRPLCAADGFVPVHPRTGTKAHAPRLALLTGYLVSGRARPVRIKAGVGGLLRVWIHGQSVVDATRGAGSRPFQDEIVAQAELREGVNPILLVVGQLDDGPAGFWLRVHDLANRPAENLLFAPGPAAATCSLGDLLAIDTKTDPVRGGFRLSATARLPGLAPRGLGEVPYRAELAGPGGVRRELARGSLAASDVLGGGAKIELTASPPERPGADKASRRADLDLALSFGGDEARRTVRLAYRGELHERIAALEEPTKVASRAGAPAASADSLALHVRSLVRALAENQPDEAWLAARTADAEKIAAALAAGKDPYRSKKGVVHRAYRSRLDGELQPYVLFVPPSYEPEGKPLPLVVVSHGLNRLPEHALRTVIGEAPDERMELGFAARHMPAFPDQRAILAAPFGYGAAGPRALGEEDVLTVVREVQAHYRIDERRISITGYSLGGTVAFTVPLHYPDLFSAAAPLCGYPNLPQWDSIRGVPHTPWEDVLVAKRYIGNYAENGLHVPLHIVHGGLDGPARSALIADRYKELGYPRIFDVRDELDHNVWDYAYHQGRMIEWLKARRRPEAPPHVRLSTGEYRYDRAYWVRLVAMRPGREGAGAPGDRSASFADIDAVYAKAEREIRVTTRNVGAFALDLAALDPPAGTRIVVDGDAFEAPTGGATAFFDRSEGEERPFYRLVPTEPSRAGKKRRGVSGPLDDVQRHAQLVVYGTADPSQTETNRMVATHYSSYDTWASAHYPIKADADVTEEDLRGRSLVLIGGPSTNRVTAQIAESLPVKFEPNALTLRGKRFEGEDVGVSLVYPHPRDPDEYVVLHAGVGFRGTLASRHLPRFAPDFLVYDARITVQRGDHLLDQRAVLDGGFFDDDWR